jgi:tRNA-modifying protein YgfZ
MPRDEGCEETESQIDALRHGAGASLLDDRVVIAARGTDRATFLQGMLTNEVAKLTPGQGTHALLLTEQGKIVAEIRLHVLVGEIWLEVARAASEAVRAALERFIVADDVELVDLPVCGVALRGPSSEAVLAAPLGPDGAERVFALAEGGTAEVSIDGIAARCARRCDLGTQGFAFWVPDAASARGLLERLCAAGARAVGPVAVETFRIAGGVPLEGVDFGAQTIAPEVPFLAPAISFRKGCYLGQEVVERVAARGHVNWVVVGLTAEVGEVPAIGAPVFGDGREVGRVTSATRLPPGGGVAMLARVRRAAVGPDAALEVECAAGRVAARVAAPTAARD